LEIWNLMRSFSSRLWFIVQNLQECVCKVENCFNIAFPCNHYQRLSTILDYFLGFMLIIHEMEKLKNVTKAAS